MITCKFKDCKKILVEGMTIEQYLEKYPDEKYMWCCYCRRTFPIQEVEE